MRESLKNIFQRSEFRGSRDYFRERPVPASREGGERKVPGAWIDARRLFAALVAAASAARWRCSLPLSFTGFASGLGLSPAGAPVSEWGVGN